MHSFMALLVIFDVDRQRIKRLQIYEGHCPEIIRWGVRCIYAMLIWRTVHCTVQPNEIDKFSYQLEVK